MTSVFHIAEFILETTGDLDALKLQKLVYYCQGWSLVKLGRPLFHEEIEAWAKGPCTRCLWQEHKGKATVRPGDFEYLGAHTEALTEEERRLVLEVLEEHAHLSADELVARTHEEAPWQLARVGLAPGERGSTVISLDSMAQFFRTLAVKDAHRSMTRWASEIFPGTRPMTPDERAAHRRAMKRLFKPL